MNEAIKPLPLAQTIEYEIEVVHSHDEGIGVGAVAGPVPQNASLVRLHAPIEFLTVYWRGVAEGKPPILPCHKDYLTNLNRVFLGGDRAGIVTPMPTGHRWAVAGVFRYLVVSPEGLSSPLALAKCPWEGTASTDFYIPAQNFQPGLLNPQSAQPPGVAPDPDVIVLDNMIRARS